MNTFDFYEFLNEANRPGGALADRSLEGFRTLLDQLQMQMKSVQDQNVKNELYPIVNQFYEQMRQILMKYHGQGVGYSQNYQPNPSSMGTIAR